MADAAVQCVVLGGGGHASVVIDALQLNGITPRGVLDPRVELHGTAILGAPVLGGDELLTTLKQEGVTAFVLGLGSIGRNIRRGQLMEEGLRLNFIPLSVIHPAAACSRWANIGKGTVILANAVVNAGARIGVNVIVNSGAIVEHDCSIGDHTHIASGARVSGHVHIGSESFIGAGATIKQGVVVGNRSVVGAGAVVLHDVAPGETVVGVPAKIVSPR